MGRMLLHELFYIILHPIFVLVGYVCIFILSYRTLVGIETWDSIDYVLTFITLTYTLYYPLIVSCALEGILNSREEYPRRNIYIAAIMETSILLLNIVIFNNHILINNQEILFMASNIIGLVCYAYILSMTAKVLVAAEGYGLDRYRQFGYALLMYFNIIGAYVIWKKLRLLKNKKFNDKKGDH